MTQDNNDVIAEIEKLFLLQSGGYAWNPELQALLSKIKILIQADQQKQYEKGYNDSIDDAITERQRIKQAVEKALRYNPDLQRFILEIIEGKTET